MADYKIASYGAEHEWADHPLDRDPPQGFGRDVRDVTIVNSNGIANDPKGKTYRYGGEFNTPPTNTIQGQIDCMARLKEHYPEATINYRSNLHLHVRIPGLKDDLQMLKQLQAHIHMHLPQVLANVVEPIPSPSREVYTTEEEWKGARRRFQRRRVSHQTFLTDKRLSMQSQAQTVDQFFNLEPPQSADGKPLFHLQPRVCVNLRQLLQTDTLEFRHFPGTMDEEELEAAFEWVRRYTEHALEGLSIGGLAQEAEDWLLPKFLPYHHETEVWYRKTVHDGTLEDSEIRSAVRERLSSRRSLDESRIWMIINGYAVGATQ
jgi:hypothetical protein